MLSATPPRDSGINDVGLPPSEITIADALRQQGYATICIGKWHLGHTPEFMPRKRGFDEYYGILYSSDMRPVQLVHNEEVAMGGPQLRVVRSGKWKLHVRTPSPGSRT